jgi:chemotaxis protein MotB
MSGGHDGAAGGAHYNKINNHHGGGGGHHEEEGEEGEGPWLMSFADMVTLLMCFFILFFQTSKGNVHLDDPEKLMAKLEAIQKILGSQPDDIKAEQKIAIHTPSGATGQVEQVKKELTEISNDLDLVFTIGVPQPGEVELTFLNTRFFRPGSAELTVEADTMLKAVAAKLKALPGVSHFDVEGHTDADPIKDSPFPSNWELSGARASTVVRLLAANGLEPKKLKASGLAEYQPIVPEKDRNGQPIWSNKALNRRIVIRVRQDAPTPDEVKAIRGDKGEAPDKSGKGDKGGEPKQRAGASKADKAAAPAGGETP